MGYEQNELSIVLTGDEEITSLNSSYRKKAFATDVLSFSMHEGQGPVAPGLPLGDVVISIETARRQAKELEVSLAEELLRLLIHGILHLCGFEHENVSKKKASEMRKMEDLWFDKLEEFVW